MIASLVVWNSSCRRIFKDLSMLNTKSPMTGRSGSVDHHSAIAIARSRKVNRYSVTGNYDRLPNTVNRIPEFYSFSFFRFFCIFLMAFSMGFSGSITLYAPQKFLSANPIS